jgi:allophanate hydrolase/aspartyl-tRNA(Asn)/glutamyl-tRNA(Gln) amidotransferase subunit A
LEAAYALGHLTPSQLVDAIHSRIARYDDDAVWITLVPRDQAIARARELERDPLAVRRRKPLWGIPFSVKDCIDVAGLPTTSACPRFAYHPQAHSAAVSRLLDAGAILIGKTNMDQFATGLVGTRSPYGIPRNPFHRDYIPGGSSSGSAVSVAAGFVSFSIATDTGGSGRVPAAFNNLIGLKPTAGRISSRGVVAACQSIETLSIFASTVAAAWTPYEVVSRFDPLDPYSRRSMLPAADRDRRRWTIGVPAARFLDFFGNSEAEALFRGLLAKWRARNVQTVEIDYSPFLEINRLLFEGPWLAERYGVVADLLAAQPDAFLPVTRDIIAAGARITGVEVFRAQRELSLLRREVDALWNDIDALVVPTTGTVYTTAEIEADPIALNAQLGRYTSFVNLAGLAAVAFPTGFLSNGVPQGATLIGPALSDHQLAHTVEQHLIAERGEASASFGQVGI